MHACYLSVQFVFNLQPGDIFCCLADLGWVAGHTSVVYGPLCNGVTTVLFESVATYPDCGMHLHLKSLIPNPEYLDVFSYTLLGRYWEMIERLKITHLYTIPTVMKYLMKAGDKHVEKHNLSTLKVLALGTTVQLKC